MIVPMMVPVPPDSEVPPITDRGNRFELVALAERRLRRIQARGDQHPATPQIAPLSE